MHDLLLHLAEQFEVCLDVMREDHIDQRCSRCVGVGEEYCDAFDLAVDVITDVEGATIANDPVTAKCLDVSLF